MFQKFESLNWRPLLRKAAKLIIQKIKKKNNLKNGFESTVKILYIECVDKKERLKISFESNTDEIRK